jgi:type VI protein secretion system component Hcp
MRRGIWIGVVAIAALVAAPALWLVLGDGGAERRAAALSSTPATSGSAGSLVLASINKGNPIAINSFGLQVERAAGLTRPSVDRIELVRVMDNASAPLMSMVTKGSKAATGTIELKRNGDVYATLALTNVAAVDYSHGDQEEIENGVERLVLEYETIALSQALPSTIDGEIENREAMIVAGVHADPVAIQATKFSVAKGAPGSGTKVAFPPFETTLISNGRLLPGLIERARSGTSIGDVRIHLRGPSGEHSRYARYDLRNAALTSLEMAPNNDGVLLTRIGLSYSRVQLETYARNANGLLVSSPGYCWDIAAVAPC